jgi:phosphatidyl-myo-inositol dimannoside synthase
MTAVLGTVTQETGHGGIARVSVLLWHAMERLSGADCRMVTLLTDSRQPKPADKLRFAWDMAGMQWRGQVKWILFDHLGIAAVQNLVPSARRAPYAVFLHSIEVWCPLSPRQKRVLRAATIRIANSHYTAGQAAKVHPDIGPIAVCHLALPPDEAGASPAEAPDAELAARIGRNAVLIVGRMSSSERYKGHDQLIEAWPRVRQSVPDAQLVIVGGGDDLPRLQAAASQTGTGEAILFTGRISDPTLEMLYARAAVFAMPSRAEGFGLVYLEAMRHGLACVASTQDAAREVVEHGKTGFLVDQNNIPELACVLVQLLENPALRREMGDAGLRRVESYFSFDQFQTRLASAMAPFFSL